MTTSDQTVAPPQLSPDGHWWWDGTAWVPAAGHPAVEAARLGAAPATASAASANAPTAATGPAPVRTGTLLGGPNANVQPAVREAADPDPATRERPTEPVQEVPAEVTPPSDPLHVPVDFFAAATPSRAALPDRSGWGAPVGAALPAGYPAPPPVPPAPAGRSWVCVAALVLGLLPTSFAAVIVGVLGLLHASRTHKTGKKLAITGIVLGLAWTGVVVAVGALDGKKAYGELKAGDCVGSQLDTLGPIRDVPTVPCTQPHEMEVFATYEAASGGIPSRSEMIRSCTARLGDYTAAAMSDPTFGLSYIFPDSTARSHGERTTVCLITTAAPQVGSLASPGGRSS
jgi:hypothetical protein